MAYNPYDDISKIVHYKNVWETGNEQDKQLASQQAKTYYSNLEQGGYGDISSMLGGMGASQANTFAQGYNNYQPTTAGNQTSQYDKPLVNMNPRTSKENQGYYQQGTDKRSDNIYDFIYGSASNKVLESPLMSNMMDYYSQQGEKAYQDTLGDLAAYTGGRPSSWAARGAAGAKQDYTAQGAMMAPQMLQTAYGMMADDRGFYAGRESEMYGRTQAEKQYDDNYNLTVDQMTGGVGYGTIKSRSPYFDREGNLVNPNLDYQAMINALDPNDPHYEQQRNYLEQARYEKVQMPEYSQYAQGVTAPIYSAPTWEASSANPINQAQILQNQLTEQYGGKAYEADIAGKEIANRYAGTQADIYGDFGAPMARLEYDTALQQHEWNPKIWQAEINASNAKAYKTSSGGNTTGVKPPFTITQVETHAKNMLKETVNTGRTDPNKIDKKGNPMPITKPKYTKNEIIDYVLGSGYDASQVTAILERLGFTQADLNMFEMGVDESEVKVLPVVPRPR